MRYVILILGILVAACTVQAAVPDDDNAPYSQEDEEDDAQDDDDVLHERGMVTAVPDEASAAHAHAEDVYHAPPHRPPSA